MKSKILLLLVVMAVFSLGASAQTDVTPSRYKFANQPVGVYKLDSVAAAGWNVPASWGPILTNYNNGFFVIAGAATTIYGGSPNVRAIQSGISIADLGGEIGKVLCVQGQTSNYKVGTSMADTYGEIFNLNFYGPTTKVGSKKYRMRVVFSVAENLIRTDASPFDKMYAVTYTGNPLGNTDQNNVAFPSKFFALKDNLGFFVEDDNGDFTYDPSVWEVNEYDITTDDVPFRLKMEIGNMKNATLLIKEITFTINPTGTPIIRQALKLQPGPTGLLNITKASENLRFSTVKGEVSLYGLQPNDKITVYNASGQLQKSITAVSETAKCTLQPGFYIFKSNNKLAKVIVK